MRPYEPPSARSFGTPETPSQLRMSSAINSYPLNAKYKAIGMRALREVESLLISMRNNLVNVQVPAVQLNAPPEI